MMKNSLLWWKIAIVSFVIMFLFRIFNKPYLFGKNFPIDIALIAQVSSGIFILVIILGLILKKKWGLYLSLIDIAIGFVNHIVVIIIFAFNPNIFNEISTSQSILLNNYIFILYPLITLYWVFLGYNLYKNRKIFG